MTLQLCINNSERERLDKSITNTATFSGNLIEDTDVLSPSILLNTNVNIVSYNYAIISSFNRHYFIDDIINEGLNLWRVNMSVDVLSTYSKNIKNQSAIISRQENALYNKYYNDGTYQNTEESFSVVREFPNPVFDDNFAFLITAYGGRTETIKDD